MKRIPLLLVAILALALALNVSAAGRPYNYMKATAPSGACKSGSTWTNVKGGAGTTFYRCEAGAWIAEVGSFEQHPAKTNGLPLSARHPAMIFLNNGTPSANNDWPFTNGGVFGAGSFRLTDGVYGTDGATYDFEFSLAAIKLAADDSTLSVGDYDQTTNLSWDSATGVFGIVTPTKSLQWSDGRFKTESVQLTSGAKPACDAAHKGLFWYVAGGAGVADTVEACTKDAADAYAWHALF